MIGAFIKAYGSLLDGEEEEEEEEVAWRVALVFGVHLMVWPWRVPGWVDGEGEEDRVAGELMERCVRMGRDCCVSAYGRDREFFRGGVLSGLFFAGEGNDA